MSTEYVALPMPNEVELQNTAMLSKSSFSGTKSGNSMVYNFHTCCGRDVDTVTLRDGNIIVNSEDGLFGRWVTNSTTFIRGRDILSAQVSVGNTSLLYLAGAWILGGYFGLHRLVAGKYKSALYMCLLFTISLGLGWGAFAMAYGPTCRAANPEENAGRPYVCEAKKEYSDLWSAVFVFSCVVHGVSWMWWLYDMLLLASWTRHTVEIQTAKKTHTFRLADGMKDSFMADLEAQSNF